MADIQPENLDLQDIERRRLGLTSLQLKLTAAQTLIAAASRSINDIVNPTVQTGQTGDTSSLYLKMESAFGAMDETIRNLELAQSLCAKLGSSNIPRLQRFRQAIESGGQIAPLAPPHAE